MKNAQRLFRRGAIEEAANALEQDYPPMLAGFIARLSALGRVEVPPGGDEVPPWLAELFLRRDFRVLVGSECRHYFASQLPDRTIPEGKDWFFELKNVRATAGIPPLENLSNYMADAALMLQAGEPRIFNPLTGGLSKTALSVLPDLVLLRDTAENVFVSCAPRPFASSTFECTYILPERGLMLVVRGENDRLVYQLIREDLARVASNYCGIAAHALQNTRSRGMLVSDRPVIHLGHYLWNCLSAWETLHQMGLAGKADGLASWTKGEFFGDPLTLVPEVVGSSGRASRIESMEQAAAQIQSSNHFWLPLYDRHIRRELADRIIRRSESVADGAFMDEAARLRVAGGPVILLTIRTGNRVWMGQEQGYGHIIRELARRFPGAAFVLDGMNESRDNISTHRFMDTDAELEIAERIIASAGPGVHILNTIGMPIAHSIVACKLVDAFVAPWGTAMAKYRWVANKPGVAFGGQADGPQRLGVRVFDRFRDDLLRAIDIPGEHIRDAGPGNLDQPLRRNFHMRWEVVLDALLPLLQELGFDPTGQGAAD